MSDSVAPATTTAPAPAAPAPAPATSSWEQCSPDRIKDSPTGKRVLLAAKLWNNGREKLQAGDETCVDDFGHAIHLDILGASFFADLVPRNDGGIGDRLQSFLEKAVAEDSPRAPKDRIYALITRAYITFLLTATPQLNMPNKKDGAKIVRLSADLAVKYDPKDPRLLVIRAGFLSQLGGDRSKVSCAVDSRKALELAESEIKEAEKSDLKPEEKSERLAWLRLQKAHANLQLGDLYWSTKPGNPDRNLAETHLKAYVDLATECDPDMHSACYKLAILALWNMTNPKKVPIVPNLVRQYPQKLQPALTMYRRGLAAEEFHRRWLPAGMDEQTGPTARTWLKMVSRALSANPSVKPNPLVPHPGPTCENASCPKTAPKDGEKKGMCSKCLWANYCSRSCQVEHWKAHKAEGCREGRGYSTITADGEFLRE